MSGGSGSESQEMTPPEGFAQLRHDDAVLIVRRGWEHALAPLLAEFLHGRLPAGCERLSGGRGETVAVQVAAREWAVLRRAIRGGLPARFARSLYFGIRPRPFAEIAVTEVLRKRGVRVPEPLGAAVRWVLPGCYRGAIATRQLRGATNLWDWLRSAESAAERQRACAAALQAVADLQQAGGVHPDLNLKNFLVLPREKKEPEVWIVDCDRVRICSSFGPWRRKLAWRRLQRSARRLDPGGAVVDPQWLAPGLAGLC